MKELVEPQTSFNVSCDGQNRDEKKQVHKLRVENGAKERRVRERREKERRGSSLWRERGRETRGATDCHEPRQIKIGARNDPEKHASSRIDLVAQRTDKELISSQERH